MARRICQAIVVAVGLCGTVFGAAAARPVQIVALGDSLTAGYQLPQAAAFPSALEAALKAKGLDVVVTNAGVSGDTAADGLQRLDWSVPDGTDAVILEFGANDMLRGLDPKTTEATIGQMITRLQGRGIKLLLCGMYGLPSLGPDYDKAFQAIYPALAAVHHVPLYPFFLQGVAQDAALKQSDGMHPNAAGVAVMVKAILPDVEALVRSVEPKS